MTEKPAYTSIDFSYKSCADSEPVRQKQRSNNIVRCQFHAKQLAEQLKTKEKEKSKCWIACGKNPLQKKLDHHGLKMRAKMSRKQVRPCGHDEDEEDNDSMLFTKCELRFVEA